MVYELRYHLMCSVDGSVDESDKTTKEIRARNDVIAIGDANEFLKSKKSGLALPWAPMLYEGKRLVAKSDPGYPPNAHYLAWVGETRESQNYFQDLANEVCQELQDNFLLFVNKGETNQGYLAHLDSCPKCAVVIAKAYGRTAAALENFHRYMRSESVKK